MSIRKKLLLVNLLIIIMGLVIGCILYNMQKRVIILVDSVQKEISELEIYKDMKIALLRAAIGVRNAIFDPQDEEARKLIKESFKEYMDKLALINKKLKEKKDVSKRERELIANLSFFTYQGDVEGVLQLLELEAYEEARNMLVEAEKKGFKDTIETLDTLISIKLKKIEQEQKEMKEQINQANLMITAISVSSIFLISVILWFVSRGIIKQIDIITNTVGELAKHMEFSKFEVKRFKNELDRLIEAIEIMVREVGNAIKVIKDVMDKVSKGDLKGRIEGEFKGSLRDLADFINKSLDDLQTALKHVKEGLITIVNSVKALEDHANRIEKENEGLNSSIASIMTSVDETSEAIRQISEETLRARSVAVDMEKAIKNGKSKIEIMHSTMEGIVNMSKEISSITETIIEIAEQTNLLALNAAIEAARAGEMGRGFAVVADEVRRLAEISGKAARNIEDLIDRAVRMIQEGRVATEDVVESFTKIETVTKEIASIIDSIATAMEEQSRAVDIIRDNMTDISAVSERNMESVKSIAEEIRKINDIARNVEDRMERFQV